MKHLTARVDPPGEAFSNVEGVLVEDPALTRELVHHIRVLNDGTGTLLCEFSGDPDRLDEILAEHPEVIEYRVTAGPDWLYGYIHEEFPSEGGELLAIQSEYDFIIDEPIELLAGGAIRVTLVGPIETIREAMAAFPDGVTAEVERIVEYNPEAARLFDELTDRQQETVVAAMRLGYFDDPRGATYDEIAAEMGCRPETVGEHLRKAEATVFEAITPIP